MQDTFRLDDIFNIMIELETLGNKHYIELQLLTTDPKLKDLFGLLATQEMAHKELYTKYRNMNIAFNEIDADDAYISYMDALLEGTFRFLETSKEIKNFSHGYDIAIHLEKDTILFLMELRRIIDPAYFDALDTIIIQERAHLQYLYDYLRN